MDKDCPLVDEELESGEVTEEKGHCEEEECTHTVL